VTVDFHVQAQKLRQELAAAKSQASVDEPPTTAEPSLKTPGKRIDGGDLRRETLFSVESRPRNWLSESDVEFFTGAGPSEAAEGAARTEPDEGAIVQRRLIIGLVASLGLGAFALVPTEKLAPAPSKPLFFYLTPLIRVQGLLEEVEKVVPEGDYQRLRSLLALIEGSPNNVQDNLRSAASCTLYEIRACNLLQYFQMYHETKSSASILSVSRC
jgi:hypothetical protein